MNDDLAIEASGLAKSYRDVAVLAGVDLNIPRGSVFALLGPNGAGKTTTIEICEGYRSPDAGMVAVLGMDPAADARALAESGCAQARVAGFDVRRDRSQVRRRISLTGQFAALDEAQTGEENLRMIARLAGLPRAAARRRAAATSSTWCPGSCCCAR